MDAAKIWITSQPFTRIELRPRGALGYFGINELTGGSRIESFEGDPLEIAEALTNTLGYFNAYDDVWQFRTGINADQWAKS
jgi:hypothetical protein